MRLTQIKLAGFKSFPEPTVISTPSQLVGVVGPNGCGKSNIIDAVRWVLGESRASELRGDSMQDVIFNGSAQRKPAGRASVELVFDNARARAGGQWAAYNELAVRRVLTRDGASTYSINNQVVRRRDIHDIFLGTGLGTRGYAIIGQGMIHRLIESRPQELRVTLEEAAGVSRYKERRRETENRLADTRENMVRVEDIQSELAVQLERLETQAAMARQYRAHQEALQHKQHALCLLREGEARAEQARRQAGIERAQVDLERITADLRAQQAMLEEHRQAHVAAGDAVHQAQGRLFEAGARVSRLEAEIRHIAESRSRADQRRGQLQQQLQEWQGRHRQAVEQLAELESELEIATALLEQSRERCEELEVELPPLEARVQDVRAERDRQSDTIVRLQKDLALLDQSRREAGRQQAALQARRARLEEALRGIDAPRLEDLGRAQQDYERTESELQAAQQALAEREARLPALQQTHADAAERARLAADRLARLEARHGALEQMQKDTASREGLEPWLVRHGLDALTPLWTRIRIEPGWETALEAVLRERLSALEVSDLQHAADMEQDAPPTRLALHAVPAGVQDPVVIPDMVPLLSLLHIQEAGLQRLMALWLAGVQTAPDLGTALNRRGAWPVGTWCVVPEGHLVGPDVVLFHAPDGEQSGLLARAREMDELAVELLEAGESSAAALADVAAAEQAWAALADAQRQARDDLGDVTARLHDLELSGMRLREQNRQSQERLARLDEDLQELDQQAEELRIQEEESHALFEDLDADLESLQSRHAEMQRRVHSAQEELDEARGRLRDLERTAQEADFRERSLRARRAELGEGARLAQAQEEQVSRELRVLEEQGAELDASDAETALQEALEERVRAEEALSVLRRDLENLAAQVRGTDEACMGLQRDLEPCRNRITELQLQEQAARLAVERHAAELDEAGVDRTALTEMVARQPETWRRAGWLQSEIQRTARVIEALGPVNLAALDELEVARDRKRFLDAQHEDLDKAVATLEDAIRKIDRETRQLLQETFEQVNRHFGELFPQLFGGGEARLIMTGDEILDAGVQVMAQPPGKRNSTIQLLSGGEKALTATALVFALFRLNPAPFCLLDEVDAPLDDANTERYAALVSNMSAETQFLFISHNKIAMQMARQLIGVTMQEQGVSRIVAVDMESALDLAEA